jgi:hypothetical protein
MKSTHIYFPGPATFSQARASKGCISHFLQETGMFVKYNFATGLLATAAVLAVTTAYAQEGAKDPKTGKGCVTFMSSEMTPQGQVRMNYRNTCANAFQIQVQAGENIRNKSIEAGSPEKPSKAYVTCKSDDRCEVAKWKFE